MQIDIYYCKPWNYEPEAASLAAKLRRIFNAEVKLIPGVNGIFDVVIDWKCVFSKSEAGRFSSYFFLQIEKAQVNFLGSLHVSRLTITM